jgi:UDP-glucose 4-epimerase
MRVLVTGGAGFIGSHIVDRLIAAGGEVVIIDNLCTGSLGNINPNAVFLKKDIRDRDLPETLKRHQIEYVVHQAAQTTVAKSLSDPRYDCDVNIVGLVNLLEACRQAAVKRVVFASSAAVYGNVSQLPIEETVEKRPTSFYGLSKLTEEHYLDMYWKSFGLEYVALRYANVYGERQLTNGEGGVVSIFCRQFMTGEPLTIYGEGEQTRDFVYVRDVAEANYRALTAGYVNRSYNVSTAQETSVKQLAGYLREIAGTDPAVQYLQERKGDISRSALANEAATEGLGWQPQFTLTRGLTLTYNWLTGKTFLYAGQAGEVSA